MTQEQSINILINLAKLAQKAGILTLDDAVLVKQAVDVFVKPDKPIESVEEMEKKTKKK